MGFKLLKEETNGWDYKVVCPLPISLPNWIKLSKEINDLVQKVLFPDNGLAVRLFLDKHEKASIHWEIKILDSSDNDISRKKENHFLTLSIMLEIEKKFSEIQKQEGVKPEMYITFIPRGGEHAMDNF